MPNTQKRISEELRKIKLNGFKSSGNILDDVIEFSKFSGRDPQMLKKDGEGIKLGLRLKLGDPMTVHVLTDGVCKKVQNVKIEHLPTSCPQFLKTPFLIEAKPGSFLFDDIDAIGGYFDNDDDLILLTCTKNGIYFSKSNHLFKGLRLDQIKFIPRQGSIISPTNENPNVLPFIMVLALMLEADKTPVRIDKGAKKSKNKNTLKANDKNLSDWVECRVYIDAKLSSKPSEKTTPMDKEGKEKKKVQIKCFLRYQAYGPEHSLRKWIYVEDHQSTRWVNTGDKRIIIDNYFS
jgi:hypothetical protein